jgi:hypothetical protein
MPNIRVYVCPNIRVYVCMIHMYVCNTRTEKQSTPLMPPCHTYMYINTYMYIHTYIDNSSVV